jgi:diguanylate cyclase (GGDEF)-like protein
MKECTLISKEKLLELMREFEIVYDVVRTVEPNNTAVVKFDGDRLVEAQMEPCFAVWEKNKRCDNCISLRACMEKKRITKFEFRNEEIYSVVAMPFEIEDDGKRCIIVLELVNHVSDDMVLQTYGTGFLTNKINNINRKIYEDSLTGVFNRRYYDENLYIYEMTHVIPKKIAFLIVDVNKFKHVNDTFGHRRGDELLIHVAAVLKSNVRHTDKVMRFGGDEFLIVLRECSRQFVEKKILQLKKAVSQISLEWMSEYYHPSIAVGMAYTDQFDGSQEQVQRLCEEADEQMYENKNAPLRK